MEPVTTPVPTTKEDEKQGVYARVSKKPFFRFKLTPEEIKEQVEGYKTLKPLKTARGAVALCVLILMAFTALLMVFASDTKGVPPLNIGSLIELAVYAALGLAAFMGNRWASVGLIVLWTGDKIFQLSVAPGSFVVVVLWWFVFTKCFYNNYQVETARSEIAKRETEKK